MSGIQKAMLKISHSFRKKPVKQKVQTGKTTSDFLRLAFPLLSRDVLLRSSQASVLKDRMQGENASQS